MQITINGQLKQMTAANIHETVALLCKNPQHVLAELNGSIIAKENWSTTVLKDGDTIELVTFVGGG